jgi:hypothetical protein
MEKHKTEDLICVRINKFSVSAEAAAASNKQVIENETPERAIIHLMKVLLQEL